MKKLNRILIVLLFVFLASNINVQNNMLFAKCVKLKLFTTTQAMMYQAPMSWNFSCTPVEVSKEECCKASDYFFGGHAGAMKARFENQYIILSEIKKPIVYKAVLTVEKHLKKLNKHSSVEMLRPQMEHVFAVAIALHDAPSTDSFELALSNNIKSAEVLLILFERVKLNSIY